MKIVYILLSFFLINCGNTWHAEQPFRLQIDSPEIPQKEANDAFNLAINQLGGLVTDFGTQVVHIVYDSDCTHDLIKCPECNPNTLGHVERLSQDTIRVCPRGVVNLSIFKKVIMHETGHVLGQWDHLPLCNLGIDGIDDTFNIMCSKSDCYLSLSQYTPLDINFICSAGRIHSSVCGN